MGDDYVVKLGRSLVKGIVGKSRRVVKKSIAKVFDSRALDHILEKSTAMAVLDHRFSSACHSILEHISKYSSQKPQYCKEEMASKKEEEEELGVEIDNEEALIPPPKLRPIKSIDNDDVSSSTLAEPIPPCTPEASKEEEEEEEEDDDDEEEEEEDDDGVCKRRGEYSSLSEEEFKEMVEGFIERFNERMSQEHSSANHHDS